MHNGSFYVMFNSILFAWTHSFHVWIADDRFTVHVSLQNATIRTTLLSSPILYPSRTHLGKIAEKQITDGFLEFFRRESEHQFQSVPDPKAP